MATFESIRNSRRPGDQPRPKVMERMPDPPPPAKGDAFEIDEKKLRSALPVPDSDWWTDVKVLGAIFGVGLFVIALVAMIIWTLIRAFR